MTGTISPLTAGSDVHGALAKLRSGQTQGQGARSGADRL